MPVNWKDPEAFTRLLAAMVAAQDMKLDYRKIASMYGNGATYDSIEGRFRIIKKEAAALKAELDNGDRPEASAKGTPKKTKSILSAPKKEKTIGGRINKSNGTPTKKSGDAIKGIKEEADSNWNIFMDDEVAADTEGGAVSEGGVEGSGVENSGVEGSESKLYDDDMDVEAVYA